MLVRGVAEPVGEPGQVGGEVDVEPVEHPQLAEQLVAAGVEPVDLAAADPGGVGDHERVASIGLGLARIEIGGAAHHQARHVGDRHAPSGGDRDRELGDRAGLVDHQPGVRRARRRGPSSASRSASSLPIDRANRRSPSSSRTSAKCSSLPTSSPIHTSPHPVWPPWSPLRSFRPGGKAVPGALAVIHLTNQRSIACPHQRFTHPTVPVATPPRPSKRQGAMSHAGTAGLPKPSASLRAHEKVRGTSQHVHPARDMDGVP